MKCVHVNRATLSGRVRDLFALERDSRGRPLLRFSLDSQSNPPEAASSLDVSETHRCVASDDLAETLAETISDGTTLLVDGPLFVNSRAAKPLYRRIVQIPVQHATALTPVRPPRARSLVEAVRNMNLFDSERLAQNDIHLVGRLDKIVIDGEAPRITISTRVPFRATHDVVVWTTQFDPEAAWVGSLVEVNGHLHHHVTPWGDGQVRLISLVESDDVHILDSSRRPRRYASRVRDVTEHHGPLLRLN